MSAELLGLAFKAEMGTHVAKLVLLKLVDAGEDDGTKIYPAIATIAQAAQAHERTVQKTLRDFQKHGLLELVRKGGGGPGDTNEYHLNLTMLRHIRDVGWAKATGQEEVNESADMGGATPPLENGPESEAMDGIEASKGGPSDHPTPPIEPLVGEREGARDASERFEDQLRRLRKAWHNSASEMLVLVRSEFYRLTDREREACIAAIPAFLEIHRAMGWKTLPKLHEWIKEKAFVDVEIPKPKAEKKPEPTAEDRKLTLFSRKTTWVFYERIRLGHALDAKKLLSQIQSIGHWYAGAAETPTIEQERALVRFDADGPEARDWRRYLDKEHGIRLPIVPSGVPHTWAPTQWPPDHAEQVGQNAIAL